MTCIKTGAHIYSDDHRTFLYGDLYEVDGTYILHSNHTSRDPITTVLHAAFRERELFWWFSTTEDRSVYIARKRSLIFFDYQGRADFLQMATAGQLTGNELSNKTPATNTDDDSPPR